MVRRCRGTMSWWRLAERSRWRLTASVVGLQQSTRYWEALPRRHRWTVTPSLNWMRWGTSSQWSWEWSRCVKPWSNLWVPLMTRAAAFSTRAAAGYRHRRASIKGATAFSQESGTGSERMRPLDDLHLVGSVFWVFFALTLLVGWQEGHLAHKKLCRFSPKVPFQNRWRNKTDGNQWIQVDLENGR